MNLSSIIAAVANNTKRTDKDDVAKTGVTLALQRIAAVFAFRGLVKTEQIDILAGANNVALTGKPLRVYAVYWINGTQSWQIRGMTRESFLTRIPNIDATPTPSFPQWGYLEGNVLYFGPAAADVGTIKITYEYVPAMVADADENPVPQLDEALISFATAWVFKSVQMFNEAVLWEQNGNASLFQQIDADRSQSFVIHSFNERGMDQGPWIEPYLDPFQGHSADWYGRYTR